MKITFLPQNVQCEYTGHPTILDVALANEVPLNHSCGGMGSCTTCRIIVKKGLDTLESRNELEREHAHARDFKENERLSCQTLAVDGLVLEIPNES